jgi:hypothetical protein
MRKESVFRIIFLVLLGSMLCAQYSELFAQRRGGESRERGRAPVVSNLPRERTRVVVGRNEYFYSRGLFYRPGPRGYMVMRGPIGARVRVLPPGFVSLSIGGSPFFFYYGTYYRMDPVRRDYVVVNPPPGAPEPQTLDKVNLADGQTISGTYLGGTRSTVQIEVDGKVQEIAVDQIVSIEFAPPEQQQ